MKQVIQNVRDGQLRVVDVPSPPVQPGYALVRTSASLISAGTERMVVGFARKSLIGKAQARPDLVQKVIDKVRRDGLAATLRSVRARLDEPLPLGYSAAGTVVTLGEGLEGLYRVGQRVAMAGAGVANHAELNTVPRNLLAAVPDNVGDDEAAFATLGAIALHAVRNTGPGLGDVIAVLGAGLLGLLSVRLLSLAGCRVIAVDLDPSRRDLARSMGAELAIDSSQPGALGAVQALTGGRGADAVLVAASSDDNAALRFAGDIARDRARVCLVGKVGTEFPFADYMKKELSVVVSRSYGPGRYDDEFEKKGVSYPVGYVRWTEADNLAECLRLMALAGEKRLDVRPLITHRFSITEASAAYALVLERTEAHLGVILRYPEAAAVKEAPGLSVAAGGAASAGTLGVIGAGPYAKSILLPLLREKGARLKTIVTTRGATAAQAREAFGFATAETDAQAVFSDPAIDAVVIATPHDTHADLVVRGLAAGKAVFVEKPLALNRADLARIAESRRAASRFFTVGFNRRFAPYARSMRSRLAAVPGAKIVSIRVNAGKLAVAAPPGGRILGEMCHFVDLARFLIGVEIRHVAATAPAASTSLCDDVAATLSFADGSLASILYTGRGDASASKEVIEAYGAGIAMTLEDFRSLSTVVDGHRQVERDRFGQDKGHAAQLAAFLAAVRGETPPPVHEDELLETSLATLAILESVRSGYSVSL